MEILTDGETVVMHKYDNLKVGKILSINTDNTMEVEIYDEQEEKFTVAEFRKYIESQDSMGDILYNCNAYKIRAVNDLYEDQND